MKNFEMPAIEVINFTVENIMSSSSGCLLDCPTDTSCKNATDWG